MSLALVRLLHLASPALPVGAFSYSQGLEWAAENGSATAASAAQAWIHAALHGALARCEAPALVALLRAAQSGDWAEWARLDGEFLASRESAELRAETLQMGYSLARLLRDLDDMAADATPALARHASPSFPAAWALAAAAWKLDARDAAAAYLWAWLENQVMAAVKLVPLGQTAGQRMLAALAADLPALAEAACARGEDDWESVTPALTLASCQHETQYTRLFRS